MNGGELLSYVVTFLEMTERPARPSAPAPAGARVGSLALMKAEQPPASYFLYLYRAVGGRWQWSDWLARPRAEAEAFAGHPQVETFVLHREGVPAGFFMLDFRDPEGEAGGPGSCELSYLGLVESARGLGLGGWLLGAALARAWERPLRRLKVETCTLDHPGALALYQKAGFVPTGRAERTRRFMDPEIFGF
ncbi:GNAT family N-acetyltransferase [Neomegalonema sp.]|uniref:GNAT family N-acetyltransferase n=1 Tax=Neomegalonema sp. TaxID=2039713 RepID=UPI00262C72F1|nr:GNAT family N-acetyltransferase [Neomegalonema sp.]MDD2868804.1 GNAT family N-acetyltransferase [Neomegalonema sp.]